MKRIVENTNENPLEDLLGEQVTFYCGVYIYHGKLTAVNHQTVELSDAYILTIAVMVPVVVGR